MSELSAVLLGDARVRSAGQDLACRSKKSLALFLLLALGAEVRPRRELARLLWGGADEEAARTSLRTALQRLPAPMAAALQADRESLRLRAGVALDCTRFQALAASDDLAALAEAAALYGGEFWPGAEHDAAPEFDDWLQRQRTHYRQLAHGVFERLIAGHRERAQRDSARAAVERDAAFATARRWAVLEPAAEGAHRWLMQLFADSGQTDAALAQYEVCRRELAVAQGRLPSAPTQALHQALRAGAPPASAAPAPPAPPAMPAQALTSFVGRVEELAAVEGLFADPACRLVTLQGLGGVGKSRLAQVLMQQLAGRFALGATWVPLQDVATDSALPPAIAQALGVEIGADAQAALCQALRGQQRLLVLDNFEQLVHAGRAVDGVLQLLQAAPGLRLLVTSREVLGLQEEWIFELGGLECPPPDAPAAGFAAVELFVQRARQAYYGFSAAAEGPHVARLCRSVEGLPLAIELAAAWVRTMPCGDLVAAVEREIGALGSRQRNRPPRQQGLDAVVRTSWQLLDGEQQRTLAALSLFETGFSMQAAQVVADSSMRAVSALVDKSLVRRDVDGRLSIHAVVRAFARAQLARLPGAAREAGRRFARQTAELLQRQADALVGPLEIEARTELLRERPNLQAAAALWWGPDGDTPAALALPLLQVFVMAEMHREVVDTADRRLAADPAPPLRVALLARRARSLAALGETAAAAAQMDDAVLQAQALQSPRLLAQTLHEAAGMELTQDRRDLVRQRLQALEPLIDAVDDPALRQQLAAQRAMQVFNQGRMHEAVALLREALAQARGLGSLRRMAIVQDVLAAALLITGEGADAVAMLQEAAQIHERADSPGDLARCLNTLACALLMQPAQPDAEAAVRQARRALEIYERIGHEMAAAAADSLGLALAAAGRRAEAAAAFERALVLAAGGAALQGDPRYHLALLAVDGGDLATARRHALALVELAQGSRIGFLRRAAIVAAVEVEALRDPASTLARAWTEALLADADLGSEPRARAQLRLEALRRAGAASSPAALPDLAALRARLAADPSA